MGGEPRFRIDFQLLWCAKVYLPLGPKFPRSRFLSRRSQCSMLPLARWAC